MVEPRHIIAGMHAIKDLLARKYSLESVVVEDIYNKGDSLIKYYHGNLQVIHIISICLDLKAAKYRHIIYIPNHATKEEILLEDKELETFEIFGIPSIPRCSNELWIDVLSNDDIQHEIEKEMAKLQLKLKKLSQNYYYNTCLPNCW